VAHLAHKKRLESLSVMGDTIRTYEGLISRLADDEILVFGSNPQGWHGKGLAKIAMDKYGAVYGQGRGLQGRCYGLVTKNLKAGYTEPSTGICYARQGLRSISQEQIVENIRELYREAEKQRNNTFFIGYTKAGRNLNGYTSGEMASLFRQAGQAPKNIVFEKDFGLLYQACDEIKDF